MITEEFDWFTSLKKRYHQLLWKYSNNGEISFFLAIELGTRKLFLNRKIVKMILRDLFFDGLCKWEKDKIKVLPP